MLIFEFTIGSYYPEATIPLCSCLVLPIVQMRHKPCGTAIIEKCVPLRIQGAIKRHTTIQRKCAQAIARLLFNKDRIQKLSALAVDRMGTHIIEELHYASKPL